MRGKIESLLKFIEYIELIIKKFEKEDEYLIDRLDELKDNIINNKIEYAYVAYIEIINYLELEDELYDVYKDYLNYVEKI